MIHTYTPNDFQIDGVHVSSHTETNLDYSLRKRAPTVVKRLRETTLQSVSLGLEQREQQERQIVGEAVEDLNERVTQQTSRSSDREEMEELDTGKVLWYWAPLNLTTT